MVSIHAFAAGGWWVGLTTSSMLIAVLAALVVTVITLVNRMERLAGSILDNLTSTRDRAGVTWPVAVMAAQLWSRIADATTRPVATRR